MRRRTWVAGAHDDADLGNHARGQGVLEEDIRVAAEGRDALLNPRAAGVEQADDRRADLQRLALDLQDLLGVRARQGAAEHGEVLGEDEDDAAIDAAPAGDDAVTRDPLLVHAELADPVLDEHVELFERALVEEQVDPLPGRQLALGMLAGDPLLAPAQTRLLAALLEFFQDVLHARRPLVETKLKP